MTVLALDQGTTSTKAFLLHPDGRFETVGQRGHQTHTPQNGWVEHDAAELLGNIQSLITAAATIGSIDGIALANQGETVVAWDKITGLPLALAIVWQDQRTQHVLDHWAEADKTKVRQRAGLPLDSYFSASKLRWLLDQPQVAAAHRAGRLRIGTTDSFFLDRLTGNYATDVTTASRTSLMNLSTLEWDADLCALFGVPMDLLAPIRPSVCGFGDVSLQGRSIPVVASLVDQQAALFGHGCRQAGDLKMTFGTGAFALALTGVELPLVPDGFVPTIAWQIGEQDALYAVEGGDFAAATAVDWGIRVGLAASIEDYTLKPGPSALEQGVVFVPALAGLGAPHWDRDAAGTFSGLRQNTDSETMRRAILEGVALRACEIIERLTASGGIELSIDGGLSRNNYFAQFLSDASGGAIRVTDQPEMTGFGAAQLGYLGLGRTPPDNAVGTAVLNAGAKSPAIISLRHRFSQALAAARAWGADAAC